MEWLLPNLGKAKLLNPCQSVSSSNGSSNFPPPPSLPMEPENERNVVASVTNNIITLDDDSDEEDDDGPPMLDRAYPVHQRSSASSVLTVPVSKEQFSIIKAHQMDEPKTVLEALQRFNQSRKSASASFNLQSSQNNLFHGLSASPSPLLSSSISNSSSSAAADLTRLIPSLLKKPITPLAAPKKKLLSSSSTTSNYPVISFRKASAMKPNFSSTCILKNASSNPASTSSPTVSISIKETSNNPLLEMIIAQSKKNSKFHPENDPPPNLTVFSNDVESNTAGNGELELPPILDSDGEEERPPELERQRKEEGTKMPITRSKAFTRSNGTSKPPERPTRKQPPRKQQLTGNFAKSENSFLKPKINETEIEAPPILDLFGEKNVTGSKGSSTSSGVSSSYDLHSAPSCSPLAPINGERRPKTSKEPSVTRAALKRKAKTPVAAPKPTKRARKTKKSSESQKISNEFMDQQSWIPMGQPWAEMISTGGANSKTKKTAVCCFPAVKHKTEAITFNILDCISVAAGGEDGDNIGKIDRIFLDKKLGMCVNVLWYYKIGDCILKGENRDSILKKYVFDERELIASKHMDTIPCDSIQSHAFVLTFSEYCRYVAETKFDLLPPSLQSRSKEIWSRGDENYPRRRFLPHEDTPADSVFFCRKYYSVNRKDISSGPPLPGRRSRRQRQRKMRSMNRLLPAEDSDCTSENRSVTP